MKNNKLYWIFLGSGMIVFFVILYATSLGEGNEKESLLDFSCEELIVEQISTDGKGGRFVTDWGSANWVDDDLIYDAEVEKGCIPPPQQIEVEVNRFNYKSIKK